MIDEGLYWLVRCERKQINNKLSGDLPVSEVVFQKIGTGFRFFLKER